MSSDNEPTAPPPTIIPEFPAPIANQISEQIEPVMSRTLGKLRKKDKLDTNLDTFKIHLTVTAEEGLELMAWLKARKDRRLKELGEQLE